MSCARNAALCGLAAGVLALCASCSSPAPQPAEPAGDRLVLQASSAARLAYEQGNYAQAQTLYRRALTRAQAIDAGEQAADAAYNLAMSEIGLQHYEAADQLLAQAEYDAARVSTDITDIRLLRAKVAYLRERLPAAIALANDVIASKAPPRLVLQARILRGQIFCDTGNLPAAMAESQTIKELVGSAKTAFAPSMNADMAKLEGTIARLEEKMEVAARLFEAEVELLRVAHRHRDMAYALARAAEMHLRAGRPALAADRFFLAARSLTGQGYFVAGKAFVASSQSAAETAGDEAALARARLLLQEINRHGVP